MVLSNILFQNFYVILFECKCPSMLKTDSLIFQGYVKYFTAEQILWCCVEKHDQQKTEDCLLSKQYLG